MLAALAREGVDCAGCQRIAGLATALSAIFIDARGDRMIVTYRDDRLATARSPPIPAHRGRRRRGARRQPVSRLRAADLRGGARRGITVVLDADGPTEMSEDLFRIATHVVFSGECLRATTGVDDLGAALQRIAEHTQAFLAVTDGPKDVLWLDGQTLRRSPVFPIEAVDTLAAGDVFHGAFTLALAEGRDVVAAMRFAAAAAGLKCTRLGGSAAAPRRAEVEALLATGQDHGGPDLTNPQARRP